MAEHVLAGHKLLLGVTGSIAAYKTPALVRRFTRSGAAVQVVTTAAAARFVTADTLATVSGRRVLSDLFADHETWTQHVALGRWADLFVIAPLSAQTLAKMARGFADNLLTATVLSARCPVLVCPAMDHDMYRHPAVRANLACVQQYGYHVMEADYGPLASGLTGEGRMQSPDAIFERTLALLQASAPLRGTHALVTAGPTREPIDAVRVVTNYSTGTMGFALATALARLGARVTLVTGPTLLETPANVQRVNVETADEMYHAVAAHQSADYVFMAAAVADYTPATPASTKLQKTEAERMLQLVPTRDILKSLGQHKRQGQMLVGFAMETQDGVANAKRKLESKNLDWIVLNYVNEDGAGFGVGSNRVTLIGRDGSEESLEQMPKKAVAEALVERIVQTHQPCG